MQTPTTPQPRDQDFSAADDAYTAAQRLGSIRKASVLTEAIGISTELAILSGAARYYQRQVDKDLPNIRLGLLYSAANSLRVANEAHAAAKNQSRVNEGFPPRAAAALADLVEALGLFFEGFSYAAEVHAKMLAGPAGGRNKKAISAAELIVQALEGAVRVLDFEDQHAVADDLAGAKGEGLSAEIAEQRLLGRIKNMVFAIARKAYSAKKAVVKKVMEHDIIAFMLNKPNRNRRVSQGITGCRCRLDRRFDAISDAPLISHFILEKILRGPGWNPESSPSLNKLLN